MELSWEDPAASATRGIAPIVSRRAIRVKAIRVKRAARELRWLGGALVERVVDRLFD